MKKIYEIIKKYEEIIKYIIVGGCTTLVSLISYYILIISFLNPNNPLQLQIANVISWILSVSFAFITNRKIVFKSKNEKFVSEALKFFASRITTLLIDILFMFITVTVMHMSPTISKLLVQIIILVLNYLFSKFIVFNDSKDNRFLNKAQKFIIKNRNIIIIGLIIFGFSLLFPYSGDDWSWSIGKLSIKRIIDFSNNLNLNGRYFGNICVIILTKNKIIRGLIMAITLGIIIQIIKSKTKSHYVFITLLLLMMPLDMLRQSIIWTSGFANYTLSTVILLLLLLLYQKIWNIKKLNIYYNVALFCLSFLGTLIIENMTIFLVLFSLIINIIYYIKNRRFNFSLIISLLSVFAGALIMFTHPVYLNVFNGKDTYRTMTTTTGSLLYRVISNYANVIKVFALDKVILLFILMIIIMFVYYLKNKKSIISNNKIIGLFIYEYVYILYIVIKIFNPNWQFVLKYTLLFELIMSILFIIFFVLLVLMIYKKKDYNLYLIITCIIGLIAPLFVVTPIGARNFFMIYILEIILLLELYRVSNLNLNLEYIEKIVKISTLVLLLYYTNIYSYITLVNYRRYDYINQHVNEGQTNIVVPELPYNEYVWCPDFDDYRATDIKALLNIPQDVTFEFTDYDNWKSNYYNDKESKND